jgi:hypothetical protein
MKISSDINGNKTVKVESKDLITWRNIKVTGFSIQTLGNLPMTHKEGVTYTSKNEIFDFINKFGTKRQQTIIGCKQDLTLDDFINGYTYQGNILFKSLSDSDIEQIVDIIGGRNKGRLTSILDYHLKSSDFWGVASRFMYDFKNDRWSYCTGQDYIFEMKSVRKALLK